MTAARTVPDLNANLERPTRRTMNATLTLNHLLNRRLITRAEYDACFVDVRAGANVISALSRLPSETAIWRHFAEQSRHAFYPTYQDLRVIFSDLIDHRTALRYSVLPHRTRGQEIDVVTFDPSVINGIHEAFPGRTVTHALIPPSQWRALFDLLYPSTLIGPLDKTLAAAKVTFTSTSSGTYSTTPEQEAEIIAITRNLRYIDLRSDPPDPDVRRLISLPTMALSMAYPHHLEGGKLIVLMANPEDSEAVRRINQQTRLQTIPAIATAHDIDNLLRAEEEYQAGQSSQQGRHLTLLADLGIAPPETRPTTAPTELDAGMNQAREDQQAVLDLIDQLGANPS